MSGDLPIIGAFIDGASCCFDGELHHKYYPATGASLYKLSYTPIADCERAVASSARGFAIWSAYTPLERSSILLRAAALLRSDNERLAKIEVLDTGKPYSEAVSVDVLTGADVIEYFAHLITTSTDNCQSIGKDFYYNRRLPLGVCAGIGAWNYPLQIACWKAGAALAAGNAMIFKPSEETARGAVELAQIFMRAGVPAGVFNVIQGASEQGQFLSAHHAIAKVSFTGEVGTGKKVMQAASQNLKATTMELGGKSPLIIFNDAPLDEAVSLALLANFYTQGEVCTNGTRVFVERDIYEQFLEELQARANATINMGDPLDPACNFGALISRQHKAKVASYIQAARAAGARELPLAIADVPAEFSDGFFIKPHIFADCSDDMQLVREEVFGPVMAVLVFDSEDEVISRANASNMGLAAGVISQDLRRAHRVAQQLEAGIIWINQYGASPAQMPVGGIKQSGIGRENGHAGLEEYSELQSIYVGLERVLTPFD